MVYRLPNGRTRLLAHDVRHMRQCAVCGEIGDDRTMIHPSGVFCMATYNQDARYHPGCFYRQFGRAYVIDCRPSELAKFSLGDIGPKLMREILEDSSRADHARA